MRAVGEEFSYEGFTIFATLVRFRGFCFKKKARAESLLCIEVATLSIAAFCVPPNPLMVNSGQTAECQPPVCRKTMLNGFDFMMNFLVFRDGSREE